MLTTTRKLTCDQFLAYAAHHGRCELIEGEVHEMSPAGSRHGVIAGRLISEIYIFVTPRNLGIVLAAETGFVLDPVRHTVRAPDVAYVHTDRAAAFQTRGFAPMAPDLCAEVLSPDDRAGEVNQKVKAWLRFGARVVWVLDDESRTLTIHEHGGCTLCLDQDQTLAGGEVLPGFEVPLRKLFA